METPIDLAEPMTPPKTDEKEHVLDDQQKARAFAVSIARPLLTNHGLASRTPPDVNDLIRLAQWLLDGESDPLYPWTDTAGAVHLGPNIWMKPEGFLWVNGTLYEPSTKDSHDDD